MTVPHHLWLYWYGEAEPSWLRRQTLATFRRHHPAWAATLLREYPDGRISVNGGPPRERGEDESWLPPLDLLSPLPPDARCDLVRWWTLAAAGGAFADLDVLFLRPIPDEWRVLDRLALTCDGGTPEESCPVRVARAFAIGLVLSPPGCPLAADLARRATERARAWRPGDDHQSLGTRLLSFELRGVESGRARKAANLPAASLYPQGFLRSDNDALWREEREPRWDLGSLVGLHWGGGHARSREVEAQATEAWARSSSAFVARAWRHATKEVSS